MAEQTGEQIHVRGSRGREAVHPVAQLHELQQGRVLRSLSVRVVYLQDQVLDCLGVEVHAVSEQLHAVHLHVADVGLLCSLHGIIVHCLVSTGYSKVPGAAPQVEVNRLEKAFPSVSQCQRPVVAVQRQIQLGPLPVRVSVLTYGHSPAFRVTAPERIHKNRQCRLQSAVPGQTDLEGDPKKYVNAVGLHPVALKSEQHSLSPGWVEPSVDAHIVAHKHGVQTNAWVTPLEQVAQLQVLQVAVTLQAKVRVCRVRHGRPTDALGQGETRVAAGASRPVLGGTGGTALTVTHRAGDEDLAGRVDVGAGATVVLLAVHAHLFVLAAVQN